MKKVVLTITLALSLTKLYAQVWAVSDKNDHRLVAYNDSLKAYNDNIAFRHVILSKLYPNMSVERFDKIADSLGIGSLRRQGNHYIATSKIAIYSCGCDDADLGDYDRILKHPFASGMPGFSSDEIRIVYTQKVPMPKVVYIYIPIKVETKPIVKAKPKVKSKPKHIETVMCSDDVYKDGKLIREYYTEHNGVSKFDSSRDYNLLIKVK